MLILTSCNIIRVNSDFNNKINFKKQIKNYKKKDSIYKIDKNIDLYWFKVFFRHCLVNDNHD